MKCSKCGQEKSEEHFYKNYRTSAGYTKVCKECIRQDRKAKYRPTKSLVKEHIRGWNITSIMCYKRKCDCNGCYYESFFSSPDQECQMKYAVTELLELGEPEDLFN